MGISRFLNIHMYMGKTKIRKKSLKQIGRSGHKKFIKPAAVLILYKVISSCTTPTSIVQNPAGTSKIYKLYHVHAQMKKKKP